MDIRQLCLVFFLSVPDWANGEHRSAHTFVYEGVTPQKIVTGCKGNIVSETSTIITYYIIDGTGKRKTIEPGSFLNIVFPYSTNPDFPNIPKTQFVRFNEICFPSQCNSPTCGFTIGPLTLGSSTISGGESISSISTQSVGSTLTVHPIGVLPSGPGHGSSYPESGCSTHGGHGSGAGAGAGHGSGAGAGAGAGQGGGAGAGGGQGGGAGAGGGQGGGAGAGQGGGAGSGDGQGGGAGAGSGDGQGGGAGGGQGGGAGAGQGGGAGAGSGDGQGGGAGGGQGGGAGGGQGGGAGGGQGGGAGGSQGGGGGANGNPGQGVDQCNAQCKCCHLCKPHSSNPINFLPTLPSFPTNNWPNLQWPFGKIPSRLDFKSNTREDANYYASLPGAIRGSANVIYYPSCDRNAYVQPAILNYCPGFEKGRDLKVTETVVRA